MTDSYRPHRRVAAENDWRLDGISDLIMRARGASIMDIGCNRGLVGLEFARNGAALVHGCDNFEQGIATARELFVDLRAVKSQFEVVDLTQGPASLEPFGEQTYDITLLLATYHKLKRLMQPIALTSLVKEFSRRTTQFVGWRGTSKDHKANEEEIVALDRDLNGFKRIHTSYISDDLGVAAIWRRNA